MVKNHLIRLGKGSVGAFRWVDALLTHNPRALCLAFIMIASTGAYTANVLVTEARYRLTKSSTQLIGQANPALAKKIKLDQTTGIYRFNAENISPDMANESDPAKVAALLASQKQQTGGGSEDSKSLYSLDLPIDPKQGMIMYDSNSKTSFKLIPEFSLEMGRSENGRIVYPVEGGGQAIYTVKGNGIKEDIVLQKPRGDELSFKYKLELPKTLEARLDERGNLGIYSVDPAISGAIANALQNGASSTDTGRLKDIQENGTKTHLTYMIPAPTIIQSGGQPHVHSARVMYKLDGDQLTVTTSGLEKLTYPISIDPTVVVTSTSDFTTGNTEENISFDTNAISRGAVSGGSIGAWASTTSLATAAPTNHASVAYNGYLYTTGGFDGTNNLADVQYAPINSDGTIGSWTATTSLPAGRVDHVPVVYNGFMYVTGGQPTYSEVLYAPINADGTLGAWTTTTSLTSNRYSHTSLAYGGYIYIIGGQDDLGNELADVQYAPINADGTLGAWTTTTSFTTARSNQGSIVYNGYLYIIGGQDVANTRLADVQYAPINANGSLGTWTTTSSFTTARSSHATAVYNGYVYVVGGWDTSGTRLADVQYAQINANGTLGTWTATTSFPTARSSQVSIIYNGYMYITGGNGLSGRLSDVQYAKIDPMPDPTMTMPAWAATTTLGVGAAAKTRRSHASLTYRGVLYLIGGLVSATADATVHYATINPAGTVGTWASTSALPLARYDHSAAMNNHFMYVTGGRDTSNAYTTTVYYTSVNNTTGAVAAWASTTPLPAGRSNHTTIVHNNYLYVIGGLTTGGGSVNTVYYAPLSATGTVGTWNTTTVLPAARASHQSIVYNNFLYVIGGNTGTTQASVIYAPINSDGTIGSWITAANSMGTARELFAVVMDAGHIVAIGGYSGSALLSTTEYSKINTDGSLGSWTAGASFTTARQGHTAAVFNGVILLAGGWNRATTYYGDAQYTSTTYKYSGGLANLGTMNAWQTTTSSNLAVLGQASVVYGNYVYLIGGMSASSVYRNDIRYAPLNENGTIGAWTTSPNVMGLARFNGGAVAYGGRLYVVGGQQSSGVVTNTVEYASINADGSIGTWTTSGSTFTTARYGHVTAIYNGKLYVVGGGDSADTALSDVKYAPINSDGTVGAWVDTTATVPLFDADGFVYGGRIYTVGGRNGVNYYATVRYAPINSDGTVGVWRVSSEQMSAARSRLSAVVLNGYIYYSGGIQVVGATTTTSASVFYAPIKADGSIGNWQATNGINSSGDGTTAINYQSAVTYKGRIYSLGGTTGASSPYTPKAESYMITPNVPPLSGVYTQRIDFGQLSTLNSIAMNGLTPPGQGALMFRTAGADGVYGNWQLPSVLSGVPMSNVRYVMYKIGFDDSLGTAYSATTNRSSVDDVTFDYMPVPTLTPDNRLRHNKFFDTSGVLQPLETQ